MASQRLFTLRISYARRRNENLAGPLCSEVAPVEVPMIPVEVRLRGTVRDRFGESWKLLSGGNGSAGNLATELANRISPSALLLGITRSSTQHCDR